MYYHVWIERKSTKRDEFRLDLSKEEVEERLSIPYHAGEPVAITGTSIPLADVRHLQVNKTSQGSHELRPKLQELREGQSALVGNSVELLVATSGIEVTNEFLKPPPGSESVVPVGTAEGTQPPPDSREVFVVHGRNLAARDAMFTFLRAISLHPLEWSEVLQSTGMTVPYVGEILDAAFSRARAILVLFTPDDEARLKDAFRSPNDSNYEAELTGQARPNVLFEAGMAMGRSPDRTILVELGDLRPFSDVAGRHTIRLDNTTQKRQELAQRLGTAGCPINLDGTDWHSAGDFKTCVESGKSPLESSHTSRSVESRSADSETPQLSSDAESLLHEATAADDRTILKIRTQVGVILKVNYTFFGDMGDRRSEARWESALNELLQTGLVVDRYKNDMTFELTHQGFNTADFLKDRR